jgi:lysophospholipase L1-like esterase
MDQVVTPHQMLDVEQDWDAWSRELLRIADMTRAHGAEILFVAFPVDYGLQRGDEETLPVLTQLAADHGIPFLDMLPFFQDRPNDMLRDYTHPSLKGHYVTAHELSVIIRKYLDSGA